MSTPADPQPNAADADIGIDHTALSNDGADPDMDELTGGGPPDVRIDHRAAPTTTAGWSDAEVSERPGQSVRAPQLPPLHVAPTERIPEVQIRDTPTTAQPVREQGYDEPVRAQPVYEQPVYERPAPPEPELRAQPTAVGVLPDRQTVVARERERFGGMKFGSAFFGWLTATGLAVLLLAILAAAGVAFGVASTKNVDQAVQQSQNATGTSKTVGLVGAIVLLVILFVAYYCGGYVAGRMARFDGVRQGLGVWIWALITSAVIAGVAAVAGAKYNVLAQLNLPRIPVDEGSVTRVGIIAIAAAIIVALLGALLGGAVGTRFHRKVDAVGFDETQR